MDRTPGSDVGELSAYERLKVGDEAVSPPVLLTADQRDLLISLGGYTHPLFTDPRYVQHSSPFADRPFPGEALLLVMGGLAERTNIFDETTIALAGFDRVAFRRPALPAMTVLLRMEVLAKWLSPRGRTGIVMFRWSCLGADGELLVEADARMLFRIDA